MSRRTGIALRDLWDKAGMLLVFAILFVACSVFVENFLSMINMKGLALSVSTLGMVACTMLFCLASGHFDLSVGSVVACSGVLAAVVINETGAILALVGLDQVAWLAEWAPVPLGIAAGILAGGLVGLINGIVIAKFRINALITTLAMMQIVRGLGYIITGGKAVGVRQEGFFVLGNWAPLDFLVPKVEWLAGLAGLAAPDWLVKLLGFTTPVWIMVICFIVFGFLLRKTTFGRNALAIGGNEEAARLAGIAVDRLKITIFTAQGLVAGFAGVVLASRMTSGQPMASLGFELEVISACVLGGVSLTGGVGSILFVIAGVLIMGTVQNAMNLLNVPPFYQYVARGAILLGAVLFDRFKQRSHS